jgi:hypothetical protein
LDTAYARKAEFLEAFQSDFTCPVLIEKFSILPVGQIISTNPRHPVSQEGRLAIVTDVETGCGGRKLRDRRGRGFADGEVVWS